MPSELQDRAPPEIFQAIEVEWHQIKAHELVGQMFDDELDLAYAVMSGVEARGVARGYSVERFRFNSS